MDRVPHGFICPISHEIMQDPVMDPEGNTYERQRIEEWLRRESRSPLTNSELTRTQLIPNRALKDSIQEFLKKPQPASEIFHEPMALSTTSKNRKGGEIGTVGALGGLYGSFPTDSEVGKDSTPWLMLDVRGDTGMEVQDYKQLATGTQVSFDCVYPVSAGTVEAKFRHHGVFIGRLTQELWEQLEDCDPCLLNRHCVIHLQRDERRLTCGRIEMHTVEDFCSGRRLFAHRRDTSPDAWAILARAFSKLDKTVPFHHKTSNCEHFATWCTAGVRTSKQGEHVEELETTATWSAVAVGAVALLAAGAMMLSGPATSESGRRRERRR